MQSSAWTAPSHSSREVVLEPSTRHPRRGSWRPCRRPQVTASAAASLVADWSSFPPAHPPVLPPDVSSPVPSPPKLQHQPTHTQQHEDAAGPGPSSEAHQARQRQRSKRAPHSAQRTSTGGYDLRETWQMPRADPQLLTHALRETPTCGELFAILQAHQGRLNSIHLCAAFTRAIWFSRRRYIKAIEYRLILQQIVPLIITELRLVKDELQPRAIATIFHALGSLDIRDRELYAELAAKAETQMADFTPQGLSNMLWAFARTGLQPSARWMALFVGVCHTKLPTFSAQDLSTTMWSFAKLRFRLASTAHQQFVSASTPQLHKASPQALSMFLYSFVYQEQHPGDVWLEAFTRCLLDPKGPGLQGFEPQAFSLILWGLARLGYRAPPDLSAAIVNHLLQDRMHAYQPIDVATLTHALVRMEIPVATPLFDVIISKVNEVLFNLQPAQLAVVGLAVSHMVAAPELQASTNGHKKDRRKFESKKRVLAITTPVRVLKIVDSSGQAQRVQQWPWRRLGGGLQRQRQRQGHGQAMHDTVLPWEFVARYISATYIKLMACNSRDLSMMAQALARLGCQLPDNYLSALEQRIEQLGAAFTPPDISLTLWALHRLGVSPSPSLMVEFFAATDKRLSSFKPHELAVMIWALAQANYHPEKAWMEEFLHCTFPRMSSFNSQGLANIAVALSQLSVRPPPAWLYAFVKTASSLVPSCNTQDLIGLIHGLDAINKGPEGMQLQKVDDFLVEARQALADLLARQRKKRANAYASAAAVAAALDVMAGDSLQPAMSVNGVHSSEWTTPMHLTTEARHLAGDAAGGGASATSAAVQENAYRVRMNVIDEVAESDGMGAVVRVVQESNTATTPTQQKATRTHRRSKGAKSNQQPGAEQGDESSMMVTGVHEVSVPVAASHKLVRGGGQGDKQVADASQPLNGAGAGQGLAAGAGGEAGVDGVVSDVELKRQRRHKVAAVNKVTQALEAGRVGTAQAKLLAASGAAHAALTPPLASVQQQQQQQGTDAAETDLTQHQ